MPDDSSQILAALLASTTGLTLAELLVLHPQVARRTAQRWLGQWVAQGRVVAQGEGRARRYWSPASGAPSGSPGVPAAPTQRSAAPALEGTTATAPDIPPTWARSLPLSADSLDILTYVSQPLAARAPVGYQQEFLDAYQPGVTWYLPAPLRRKLHQMGRTAQAGTPAGTYSRAILGRLLIDLSWASSHLEGNTYTRLDTRELIEYGRAASGKAAIETQMILNHKAAIELLVENIETVGFDRFTLLNLHGALSENLLPNPDDEGRLRLHAVDIGQSVFRPLSVPDRIESALDVVLAKLRAIADPFEQSFFVLAHLPYLQPFADINKRTSRLAANLPLFRANLCPLTFLDVPDQAYGRALLGVYEMTRVELLRDLFVWAYERSTQEYLAIRQDLAEPEPLRLAWRDLIRDAVREVVTHPHRDAVELIDAAIVAQVPAAQRADLRALVIDEVRRLHEGVLARYGLRPSELTRWRVGRDFISIDGGPSA